MLFDLTALCNAKQQSLPAATSPWISAFTSVFVDTATPKYLNESFFSKT
jgi:hypothetical protein